MAYTKGYQKNQNNQNNQNRTGYVGAPYNFCPVAEKVVKNCDAPSELPAHNKLQEEELLSGEIAFTLKAETPVFVGGGETEEGTCQRFYRTISGKYAIPGSSIKGLLRNNMQILGMGSIAEDVEDYELMYRTVGNARSQRTDAYKGILGVKTIPLPSEKTASGINSAQKKKQNMITLPTNVQAGYIYKKQGKYYITETVGKPINPKSYGKLNYYSVSERHILNDDPDEKLYKLDRSKLQNRSFFRQMNNRGKSEWKGKLNNDYYPYYIQVYYKAGEGDKTVSAIYDPEYCRKKNPKYSQDAEKGYKTGYLISTGLMNNKKHLYVIPARSEEDGFELDSADVRAYQRDYEMKKNGLHGTKLKDPDKKELAREFYQLPEEGQLKPVFYVRLDGKTYFGFTPYLRLFYEHSLGSGLPEEQRQADAGVIDYVRSILGFSNQDNSYKSRVSCEDAVIEEEGGKQIVSVVLGEPKMTSYLDYLKQERKDNLETTYNDNFEFRGIKQYWLHKAPENNQASGKDKVSSGFQVLNTGSSFRGKIHFKNLRKEELGLLLWCIYQGENFQWNIGKAKAFGYGRMSVSKPTVKLYDPEKMYAPLLQLDVYANGAVNIDTYISAYQTELREYLCAHQPNLKQKLSENKDLKELPGIREFLAMKDSSRMPDPSRIRFMSIDAKEYQNREYALPTVEEVLAGKSGKKIEKPQGKRDAFNHTDGRDRRDQSGWSSGRQNEEQRKVLAAINETKGSIVEAEFVKMDSGRNELVIRVEGKEERVSGIDPFKVLAYGKYKKGQKVKVKKVKQNNKKPKYELAEQ